MKKIILLTLIFLFISVPAIAGVSFTLQQVPYPVLVDGEQLKSDLPILTYKANGGDNTYVPLRTVLDMMGAKTTWDGQKVNIKVGPDPKEVANSVVMIYGLKNGQRVVQGSGVIIDYDEILTAHHVVSGADSFEIIYNDGSTTTATLEKEAPGVDAAILEPKRKDVKPVKIGDSDEITMGERVYLISSPKGAKNVIAKGSILFYLDDINYTAESKPGSSGGGLFLSNGELIGIASAHRFTNNSIAKPITEIREALSN